ncbi:hypothetical protein AB0P17_02355 [Streptomyces sp. NPDC088124]|uniref:hypothetical protein n=1 Tax=Streptomyces sp. NPDC088124 TaxID=3154654 RepID=UPI00342D2320
MTETGSPLRAVRAAVFAAVCVPLAAVGHALTSGASGHAISAPVLLAAYGTTACAAWLAGGRRRGALSIGAGLLTFQGLLHLLFSGALPWYGFAASRHTPHPGGGAGMDMGPAAEPMPGQAPGSGAVSGMASGLDAGLGELFGGSAAMLAAHCVAAAVCALWLAQGEAAFFRLARAVGALAFTPLGLLLVPVRLPAGPRLIRPRTGTFRAHRFRGVVLAHTLSRRGPPTARTSRATAPGAVATAV